MAVIYRVDKFVVPAEAREQFWRNVRRTHSVLRVQPGFLDDVLLEKESGPGTINAVTIVRWGSAEDLPAAKAAVERAHQAARFEPGEFFRDAGVEADLGNFVVLGS